uniref:Uncharacterized protein n=1 Tax=Anopheles stephensi TaxID=30069 RepID=A0A182YGK7_ANOST
MCKISTRSSLAAIVLTASILADLAFATPWGNYYEYGGHPTGPQVYQYNQRVEHHRTVPDSVPASSGTINCRCTKLRYCTRILEMLRNPKSSYASFNSKLKELACGYGIDNEPNICCPLDDSWLRDVGTDDEGHSSEENDSHSAIGWDEGYTNRKSDNGHQWSKERFKYIPTVGKDSKRIGNTRPTTTSSTWWKQRPQKSNTIAQFEDPKTMKNCPPEIYPNEAEVTLRPTKAYVAPIMRTTKRPTVVLGSNRLAETTTVPITTEQPITTTELITTVLPTVVPDQPMINAPLCGLSVNTRIIGGETEVPGQFPWMARLAYRNRTSGRVTYRCAGSLITNRHVITVAHCVTNLIDELQLVSIRLGDLECNAVTDPRCSARYQDFAIDRVIPHESYDMPKYANDIALIKLRETTETYNIISPLCLPTDQYAPYALNLTGQMGIIAGWGSTSNRSNTPSPTLQWLRLPIVDTAGCATAYARYSVNSRNPIIVSENQMCAQGQENRDACQGDSGGPLMNEAISTRDRFVLLGLVSFGPRTCGVSNFPGVYTRISSYIDWILTNVMQQCTLPDNRPGQCILLRNCNSLLTLIKKKPLLDEDRTYLQRTQCGWSTAERHPLVCCADSDLVAPVRVGAGLLPTPGQCGIQTSDRIFGGVNTRIDEFPWIALLKYAKLPKCDSVNGTPRPHQDCEGLGEDVDCSPPPIDVPIESKIPHPEYVPTSTEQYNDIALLRLSSTVPYSDFIKPICLPTQAELKARDYVGFRMQVAGWGRTATARYSNVKQKVAVDGVSLDSCNQVYQREQVLLRQSQLCAGGEAGKDSCQGDSGGPLTGIHTAGGVQYWYLIGLVSFGPTPCGQAGWPGVYTKVDQYVDWVTATIVA